MKRNVRLDVLRAMLQIYFQKKDSKSKTEFARLAKTTPSSLNRWMQGNGKPRVETVYAVAQLLCVSPEDLFE